MPKTPQRIKIALLERDAGGKILSLAANAVAAPLPAKHPMEHGWLRFDRVVLRNEGDAYRAEYYLDDGLVKSDLLRPPKHLVRHPPDLLAWFVMRGWKKSDLYVYYPAPGEPAVFYFPSAAELVAGKQHSRQKYPARPLLFNPA